MKLDINKSICRGLFVALLCTTAVTWAGGVSDGGGGTSTPPVADPEWIVHVTRDYAAPAIIAYLYDQEGDFLRSNEQERQSNPLRKLFAGPRNVYDVVRTTSIELKMSGPCYDAKGNPKDGSVYANAGTICISPFTMAPKLNENTYQAETIALILHEITHLMGTDEAEAEQIQREALWAFTKVDLLNIIVHIQILAKNEFYQYFHNLDYMKTNPQFIERDEWRDFEKSFLSLRDNQLNMGYLINNMQLIRPQLMELVTPQFIRIEVIEQYLCANDPKETPEVRQRCATEISKGFQNDSVVSAALFQSRISDLTFEEPAWQAVLVTKPDSLNAVSITLGQLQEHLNIIHAEIKKLHEFRFQVQRH